MKFFSPREIFQIFSWEFFEQIFFFFARRARTPTPTFPCWEYHHEPEKILTLKKIVRAFVNDFFMLKFWWNFFKSFRVRAEPENLFFRVSSKFNIMPRQISRNQRRVHQANIAAKQRAGRDHSCVTVENKRQVAQIVTREVSHN